MAGSNIPRVQELQSPERLQDALAKDKLQQEDCTPCRVTGKDAMAQEKSIIAESWCRSGCILWPRRIQLLFGAFPAASTTSKDPPEQEHVRDEKSTSRNNQYFTLSRWTRILETCQLGFTTFHTSRRLLGRRPRSQNQNLPRLVSMIYLVYMHLVLYYRCSNTRSLFSSPLRTLLGLRFLYEPNSQKWTSGGPSPRETPTHSQSNILSQLHDQDGRYNGY